MVSGSEEQVTTSIQNLPGLESRESNAPVLWEVGTSLAAAAQLAKVGVEVRL